MKSVSVVVLVICCVLAFPQLQAQESAESAEVSKKGSGGGGSSDSRGAPNKTKGQVQASQAASATAAPRDFAPSQIPEHTKGPGDVSNGGSFAYPYVIETPAGINGLGPSLALAYSSAGSNGLLGMGFTLSGLPTIERDPSYGIAFTSADHYTYQGAKLFYIAADARFHTERESHERITAYKGASPGTPTSDPNDPTSYWIVERKDGSKLYFGSTADSRIDAVGKGGLPRLWALNRVEDAVGNYYTVEYSEYPANGDYYPLRITYSRNDDHPISGSTTVEFSYTSRSEHGAQYLPTRV